MQIINLYVLFQCVRRLIEQSTSYSKTKVPEESKLVSRRLLASRGYKSKSYGEEPIKRHCSTADTGVSDTGVSRLLF